MTPNRYDAIGGPLDGSVLDLGYAPRTGEWYMIGQGGYCFDGEVFRWQFVYYVQHQSESGHTFIFRSTSRAKLVRYLGQMAQTIFKIWSAGIFTWKDSAAICKEVRDKEWQTRARKE